MTRFSGKVGFADQVRSGGVTKDVVTERSYRGDEETNTRYYANSDSVIGSIRFQTRISIMADPYALENFTKIRYVWWAGARMKVDSVDKKRPRLTLVLGGVYNGPEPKT
jgi:hypothetical protein